MVGCRPSKFGCSADPQLRTFPLIASARNEVAVDSKELITGRIVVVVVDSEWMYALKLSIEENMYRLFDEIVEIWLSVRKVSERAAENILSWKAVNLKAMKGASTRSPLETGGEEHALKY